LRHFLRRKLGPVSASLHATRVQARPSRRALEPRTGNPDLLGASALRALRAAVPLTPITVPAERHLSVAPRTQAIENPIPLVDHLPPACQFLDKRREASDTRTRRATTRHPRKLGRQSGLSPFLATSVVTAPRSAGPERCRILALSRAQRRNYADPESRRHPALVAAALGDWGDADVLLEGSSVWEPFSALTEGNQQARSECGPSTGERVEELKVGELGAERSDLGVEAFDCGVDGVELRDGGLDEQQERVDDGRVGGQWFFGLNGIDASGDGVLAPDVVSLEEGDERVMPSAFGGFESRPAVPRAKPASCSGVRRQ
jgi:hypothetical protein